MKSIVALFAVVLFACGSESADSSADFGALATLNAPVPAYIVGAHNGSDWNAVREALENWNGACESIGRESNTARPRFFDVQAGELPADDCGALVLTAGELPAGELARLVPRGECVPALTFVSTADVDALWLAVARELEAFPAHRSDVVCDDAWVR